jgi:hypothetical protein
MTDDIISFYLIVVNAYVSIITDKVYFKLKQIAGDKYTWITKDLLNQCFDGMNDVFHGSSFFDVEQEIINYDNEDYYKSIDEFMENNFSGYKLRGIVDVITDNCIWELKMTSTLSFENQLQLIIYAWLWKHTYEKMASNPQEKQFRLFNIKTGQVLLIDPYVTIEDLDEIMKILLKKYIDDPRDEDEQSINIDEFIDQNNLSFDVVGGAAASSAAYGSITTTTTTAL